MLEKCGPRRFDGLHCLLFRGNRRRPSDFKGFDLVAAVRKQ
jgi:hypothetical protein